MVREEWLGLSQARQGLSLNHKGILSTVNKHTTSDGHCALHCLPKTRRLCEREVWTPLQT